jgi:hypothetical protein
MSVAAKLKAGEAVPRSLEVNSKRHSATLKERSLNACKSSGR